MPIFISYSQRDKEFVDKLAKNLVLLKHHVWMDRWELKVGDSLIDKVQSALTTSSAVIVIISKNSMDSGWCRRELNAVLVREIEEKRSLILPCRIDDCEIPLFLRDKLYADFHADPDKALSDIDSALSTISNPYQDRFEEPDFITDWAVDWSTLDGSELIEHHFVDHGPGYVIVSTCALRCNDVASSNFRNLRALGKDETYLKHVIDLLVSNIDQSPLNPPPIISDQFQKFIAWKIENGSEEFDVIFKFRRMGKENGFNTLVHLDNNLRRAKAHMSEVTFQPQ
jgi:hypothetical protein